MPPWGRPLGAQEGKRRNERERERVWEQQGRFEEVDSDSDDGQGVHLDRSFAGDDLHFTGADLGQGFSNRGRLGPSDGSEHSEDDVDYDLGNGSAMQVALRDKEEVLVQRAKERIRRAQAMGKVSVKLPPSELDALERQLASEQAKGKRPTLKTKSSGERRASGRASSSQNVVTSTVARRKSRSSLAIANDRAASDPAQTSQIAAPGFLVAGPDGRPIYTPFGYYPPSPVSPYGPSSRPNSRTGSTHSLQHTPPLPQSQSRSQQKRYFSVPEQRPQGSSGSRGTSSPRPMPDDPDWQPRARSTSNLPYPSDLYQYPAYSQTIPQMPVQYPQGRRNVSGPEVGYPNYRGAQAARPYAATSDPSLLRREYSGGGDQYEQDNSEDDVDYSEQDEGLQVEVAPYSQNYGMSVTTRPPGGGRPRKSRR
ncbi:hypothetical protein MMC34_007339 [Xylographa carneopallida]|nr:hypothetical protein [Xylographa carneopallida]